MDALARAERFLDITERWFPFPIDPTAVTTEELALAGLARCRRLLRGMVLVYEAPDLGGLFARAIYETYLGSLYLLLADDVAYDRLQANDDYELRAIAKRILKTTDASDPAHAKMRAQSEAALAAPASVGKRINIAALGEAVRDLLAAANDPNATWPVTMYASLFGPESYTSTHGGLGAIKQYMLEDGKVAPRISADAWTHAGNDHRLDLMTAPLMALASKVGSRVGLPTDELDEFAKEWAESSSS